VVKNEDLFDRKRPIVTYARVEIADLAVGGVRRADPKVYDRGTGQFAERKSSPTSGVAKCLNVEGMREAAEVRRQLLASGPHALQAKQQELLAAYEARANAALAAAPETQATGAPSVGRDTGHEIQVTAARDTNEDNGTRCCRSASSQLSGPAKAGTPTGRDTSIKNDDWQGSAIAT
jgi:hypothetical protein